MFQSSIEFVYADRKTAMRQPTMTELFCWFVVSHFVELSKMDLICGRGIFDGHPVRIRIKPLGTDFSDYTVRCSNTARQRLNGQSV